MDDGKKKRILSGIKPTGDLTLGSYIGAIKNWVSLHNDYDCFFMLADLHAITIRHDPALLRKRTIEQLAALIASGLDPEKNVLFIQSMVPAHAELAWVLNCYAMMGELNRMTQFKDKAAKQADNINAGLYTYPVLMAADILLYQADLVPVGEDQKQHVEITRDIANRFNGVYGDVFTLPEPYIPKVGARIMSLTDPESKMSKSEESVGSVLIMDNPDVIMAKFRRAVTDSETEVKFDPINKRGVSNLMSIYSACTGKTFDEIQNEFAGRGYGDFKKTVGEAVVETLRPVREETTRLLKEKAYLEKIVAEGATRAAYTANKTVSKVYKKVGFYRAK
jgi:tryptophanyl-tRNA synthetase